MAPVETDLTFPQSWMLGYYYLPSQKWTLLIDYEWTDWSAFEKTRFDFKETDPTRKGFLDTGNPIVRDWRDVHAWAIGSQYNFNNGIGLRLGYAYMNTAVPEKSWDPSVPDSDQHTIANGIGYSWKHVTLDAAYNVIVFKNRNINNSVGSLSGSTINGKYKTNIQVIAFSLTCRFGGPQ